jgi:hypothetical protein
MGRILKAAVLGALSGSLPASRAPSAPPGAAMTTLSLAPARAP